MPTPTLAWLVRWIEASGLLPRISTTERAALEAGTVWIDRDIFAARLSWDKLLAEPWPRLSEREQAFLDGPTETLCHLVDDWDITRTGTIPDKVWQFIKTEGFLGLTIPQAYGGQGFSTLGASAVFSRLASRSFAVAAVVFIPNSVGPGELLLHYGTPEQKQRYLAALARGEEVPCFALTEPEAGSDAASLTASGQVFRRDDDTLWLRLNWRKRYISLAPVATLVGLACKIHDPDNLLGRGTSPGITCVLVPSRTPGVHLGPRHDPMGVALPNGPTEGHDVEVPVDAIVGGPEYAGQGWRMLMECLSAGRSVSLPAQSAGGAQLAARVAGAWCGVRRQFGMPIGKFEGIEERLARIGGFTYMLEAARVFTCGAIDRGAKPAVVSAVMKYMATELGRVVAHDTLDVMGGAGLCRGPRNLVANGAATAAIGITVEGANILTRTLIIFGQGAIRCHPYAPDELAALAAKDGAAFLRLLQRHIGYTVENSFRAAGYYFTRGPRGEGNDWFRRLVWAATMFSVAADLALVTLGSRLKQRGRLSGRLADILGWIFFGLATLRRFEAEGRRPEDRPLVAWSLEYGLWQIQVAFDSLWQNFPLPLLAPALGFLTRVNPLGRPPDDRLGSQVAEVLRTAGPAREHLVQGTWTPTTGDPLAGLERALSLVQQAEPIAARVRKAGAGSVEAAVASGVVTAAEADTWRAAEDARRAAIEVDAFEADIGPAE